MPKKHLSTCNTSMFYNRKYDNLIFNIYLTLKKQNYIRLNSFCQFLWYWSRGCNHGRMIKAVTLRETDRIYIY